MALIQCPNCGNSVSDKAEACPACGNKIAIEKPGKSNTKKSFVGIGTAVVGVILCAVLIIGRWNASDEKNAQQYYRNGYQSSRSGSGTSGYSSYSYTKKTGKEAALDKAYSYLNSSAFSYTGLIEQLEYSGYTTSEATYAADNCGANWKSQALKKANSYLNSSAFSYTGLIEQLEYTGFTTAEAEYGANNCGANWKEQAVKKAKSYLNSHSGWTKSKLKSQLEYSGFTSTEAQYGVDNCGPIS